MKTKKCLVILLIIIATFPCYSIGIYKDNFGEVNFNSKSEILSSYIYRGKRYGDASFQESVSLEFYGFKTELWFDYSEIYKSDIYGVNKFSELDAIVNYERNNVEIGLKYIFVPFNECNHNFINAHIKYTMVEFPLSFSITTEIYGDKYYSTYLGIEYYYQLNDDIDFNFELGMSPYKSKYTYSDRCFSVCNLECDFNYQFIKRLFLTSKIMFNFFDAGAVKFIYNKNVNIMIGVKIEI